MWRCFIGGLIIGTAIGAAGWWAYFSISGDIYEFTRIRCMIALNVRPEAAGEYFGDDKSERALELCRLIVE